MQATINVCSILDFTNKILFVSRCAISKHFMWIVLLLWEFDYTPKIHFLWLKRFSFSDNWRKQLLKDRKISIGAFKGRRYPSFTAFWKVSPPTPALGRITWSPNFWLKNSSWNWTESLVARYDISFRPQQLIVDNVSNLFFSKMAIKSVVYPCAMFVYTFFHCLNSMPFFT